MYKLLFIDEEKEQFDFFLDYIDGLNAISKFDIVTQLPFDNLDEMIDQIIKINPDAIIVDFWLNEKKGDLESNYNVPYNGVELVEEFQSIRPNFPCFVLTAKDIDAINSSEDVNIVYTKSLMHNEVSETKAKVTFIDRIISQINHYKTRLKNWDSELSLLIQKKISQETTIFDEERIIELDNLLEKSIDNRNSIPLEYKKISNIEKLDELISNVDELLKKISIKDDCKF